MFLYIKRNKSGFPWIFMEQKKLLPMVSHDLWAQNWKIFIHGIWNPRACFATTNFRELLIHEINNNTKILQNVACHPYKMSKCISIAIHTDYHQFHIYQLDISQIILECPWYSTNLLLSQTGHQISQNKIIFVAFLSFRPEMCGSRKYPYPPGEVQRH